MWRYHNPVTIIFTEKFIDALLKIVSPDEEKLLICSKRFTNTLEYQQIIKYINKLNIFTAVENNPSFKSSDLAIEYAKSIKPQMIIAIGGGSVIDTAKTVRLSQKTKSSSVKHMLENNLCYIEEIKFIAIPTNHGTSSELTKWATIWNKKKKIKYSLSDDNNYPDFAIYDYHFVESLPLNFSLITTLDALSHSFEALWNKNSNLISDDYAIKSINLIMNNIGALQKKTTKETRIALLKATIYAGLAFSNTKTAAAHSISYPLTALFGIPHGVACSMTLFSLMKLNYSFIEKKVKIILRETGFDSVEDLWEFVKNITSKTIKFSLSEYGVTNDKLDGIVSNSFNKDRIGNNIAKLNTIDIRKILGEVL
jgi:alcohol dehydrogenase class IV